MLSKLEVQSPFSTTWTPKFYKQKFKLFETPFTNKGKPKVWLKLLIAILPGKPLSKKEILNQVGVDINEVHVGGYYSNYFSLLQEALLIKYDSGIKCWYPGEGYREYLFYVFSELYKQDKMRMDFLALFQTFNDNSIDFISKP